MPLRAWGGACDSAFVEMSRPTGPPTTVDRFGKSGPDIASLVKLDGPNYGCAQKARGRLQVAGVVVALALVGSAAGYAIMREPESQAWGFKPR